MQEIKQILKRNKISFKIDKFKDDMGVAFFRGCFSENKKPLFDLPGDSEEEVFKTAYNLAKRMGRIKID
jgi:hypothetical protein